MLSKDDLIYSVCFRAGCQSDSCTFRRNPEEPSSAFLLLKVTGVVTNPMSSSWDECRPGVEGWSVVAGISRSPANTFQLGWTLVKADWKDGRMDSFRSRRAVFTEPDQFLGQELQVLHKQTRGVQLLSGIKAPAGSLPSAGACSWSAAPPACSAASCSSPSGCRLLV